MGIGDTIDTYRSILGHGARNNRFRITLDFPSWMATKFATQSTYAEAMELFCHEVNFPKPRTMETFNIVYDGEVVNLPKAKEDKYEEITIKFRDKEDFSHRRTFMTWLEAMQKTLSNTSMSSMPVGDDGYKAKLTINLYNHKWTDAFKVVCTGVFPISVSGIGALNFTESRLLECEVVLSVDTYRYYFRNKEITEPIV